MPETLPYTGEADGFSPSYGAMALAGLLLIILGLLTQRLVHPLAEATLTSARGRAALAIHGSKAESISVVRGVVAIAGLLLVGGLTRRFTVRR